LSVLTKICQEAVMHWGKDLQLNMAIEKANELIKAICKVKHNVNSHTVLNVAVEIADMEIMLEQLKIILYCRGAVEVWKEYKLKRLFQKLEEAVGSCQNH